MGGCESSPSSAVDHSSSSASLSPHQKQALTKLRTLTQSNQVVILSTQDCPSCLKAKGILNSSTYRKHLHTKMHEIDIELSKEGMDMFQAVSQKENHHTVPMIWISGKFIGGCSELQRIERNERLKPMLNGN